VTPSPYVQSALKQDGSRQVTEIVRLRRIDEEPLALETVYLPAARTPENVEEVATSGGLYQAIETQFNVKISHADVSVQAVLLSGETARLLGVASGSPGLHLERRTYADSEVVEVSFSYSAGERQRLGLMVDRAQLVNG
jgi:GntR family transcriptional regulator